MARRHLKLDDRTSQCGLALTPKFAKSLAADRLSVTCGACELASRPQPTKPAAPDVEIVASSDWQAEAEADAAHEAAAAAAHGHAGHAAPGTDAHPHA